MDPDADMETVASEYISDPAVLSATPNYLGSLLSCPQALPACLSPTPTDDSVTTCGSHGVSGLEDAWGQFFTETPMQWCTSRGYGISIAVIDSGVDYRHPDLVEAMRINTAEDTNSSGFFEPWSSAVSQRVCVGGNGYRVVCTTNSDCTGTDTCGALITGDFNGTDDDSNGYVDDVVGFDVYGSTDSDPSDPLGHGTGCSGVSSGRGNAQGVIGYAPEASIIAIRAFSEYQQSNTQIVADAIDYAVEAGADILSMSFGFPSAGLIADSLAAAYAVGVIPIAASGNSGSSGVAYPASDEHVIAVGGSDEEDEKWPPATYGPELDVVAPAGKDDVSGPRSIIVMPLALGSIFDTHYQSFHVTYSGDGSKYIRSAGTSFAAPAVAGLVANLLSAQGDLTFHMIRHALRISADDIESAGPDNLTGRGRVNARRLSRMVEDLPAGTTRGALPFEIDNPNLTHDSTLNTAGSPADTIELWGKFHKPISWDINPVNKTVVVRIQDKNGLYDVEATIPATHANCNGPSNRCFEVVSNPNGYMFKDLNQPQQGIQKVRMVIDDVDEYLWKLEIQAKNMNQHGDWDNLWSAEDLELIWSIEIDGKVTLRADARYVMDGTGTKLWHPK